MERKLSTYRNDAGGELSVHLVTEETAGGVYLTGIGNEDVRPGDLIAQDSANSWTRVNSLDGYTAVDGIDVTEGDVAESDDVVDEPVEDVTPERYNGQDEHPDDYDPANYKVGEVNKYLADHPDAADEIRAREAEGKNRSSIVSA